MIMGTRKVANKVIILRFKRRYSLKFFVTITKNVIFAGYDDVLQHLMLYVLYFACRMKLLSII